MNRSIERNFERFARKGDAKALTRVFDRTARDLLSLAQHLVQHSSDAEDLVQSTFVTAIDRASSFDGKQQLRPWLAGILCNHAANLIRKRQSRGGKAESLDSERHIIPSASAGPLTSITQTELQQQLQHALRRLPQRYRRVLEPYLVQGERPEQIARTLDEAPGTVRTQIHRGLIKLRRFLPAGALLGTLAQPRSLTSMRSAVLEHAQQAAAPGAAAPPSLMASFSMGTLLALGALTVTSVSVLTAMAVERPAEDVVALISPDGATQLLEVEDASDAESGDIQSPNSSHIGQVAQEPGNPAIDPKALAPTRKVIPGVASPGGVWLQGRVSGVAGYDLPGIQFRIVERELAPKLTTKEGSQVRTGTIEQGEQALLADAQVQSDGTFRIEVTGGMHVGVEEYRLLFTHDNYRSGMADFLYMAKDESIRVAGTDVVRKLKLKLSPVAWIEGNLFKIPYYPSDYIPMGKLVQLSSSSNDGRITIKQTSTVSAPQWREMAAGMGFRSFSLGPSQGSDSEGHLMVRRNPIAFGLFKIGHDEPIAQSSKRPQEAKLGFRLGSSQGGPMQLVIASIDQTPLCLPVHLQLRETVELRSPIELPHNAALTGHVRMHGLHPQRGLALIAERVLESGQVPFTWFEQKYVWQGDQLFHFDARTTCDSAGRFAFEGLAPGRYKISVDETHLTLLDSTSSLLAINKVVQAPNANLDFTLSAAQLFVILYAKTPDRASKRNGATTYHLKIQQTDSPGSPSASFELIPGDLSDILTLPNTPLKITYTNDKGEEEVLWSGTTGPPGSRQRVILPELW